MGKPTKRTIRLIKAPWLSLHWRLRRKSGNLRLGRRRRQYGFGLLGVLLALIGLYFYLSNPTNLRAAAQRYLKRIVNGQVHVGQASFSFTEGIKLADIRILTQNLEGPAKKVFSAGNINLKISWLTLLKGRLAATEITAFRPQVFLVEDSAGHWNYEGLFADREVKVVGPLPKIVLREGQIHYAEEIDGEEVLGGRFDFWAHFDPSASADGGYLGRIETSQAGQVVASVSGDFNTISGTFSKIAAEISLSETVRESLPRQARAWMDKYNISGRLSVSGQYGPKDQTHIIARLEGIDFRWPMSEEKSIAISNTRGELQFSDTGITLGAGVSGQKQALRFRALDADWEIAGKVLGYKPKADFELNVSCRELVLPSDQDLIDSLPKVYRKIFGDWEPTGQIALQVNIKRMAGSDRSIQTSGFVRCLNVGATFRNFPYRAEGVKGVIRFDPEKTQLENLSARHRHGFDPNKFAAISAEGEIFGPYDNATANITISIRNMALDDELRSALHPKKQADWDMFSPSGMADLTCRLEFRADAQPQWQTYIEAMLKGVGIIFEGFPYQLHDLRGRVYIGPRSIEIGRPAGDSTGESGETSEFVSGRAGNAPVKLQCSLNNLRQDDESMKLKFAAEGLALDEQLAKALPPEARKLYDTLNPSGWADVGGTISSSKAQGEELDFLIDLKPVNATCRHKEFPYPLEQVNGHVRLRPGRFELLDFTAIQAGANFQGSGFVISKDKKHYQADLTISGKDVPLDEVAYNSLKPQQQQIWDEFQPNGKCDVILKIGNDAEGLLNYRAKIIPRGAEISYKRLPYTLSNLSGELMVQAGLVNVDVSSSNPPSSIKGQIEQQGEKQSAKLSVTVQDIALDEKLEGILPEDIRAIWETIAPRGKIDVQLDSLEYTRQGTAGAEVAAQGSILLKNLALSKPVSCREISGELSGSLRLGQEGSKLKLLGPFRLPKLALGPLQMREVRGLFKKGSDENEQWSLKDIKADLAGGRVLGSITAGKGAAGDFLAEFQAEDIELARLIADFESANPKRSGSGTSDIQGRLKASVKLEGRFNEANSTAGRGRIYVDLAQLYRLPLMVRVLQSLSLQSVDPNAFNTATVDFYVRGANIVFTEIVMDGPALRMIGTGLYDRTNDALDVVMVREPGKGILSNLPPLPEAVVAEITGSLGDPKVEAKPFRAISEESKKLFRKRKPREY